MDTMPRPTVPPMRPRITVVSTAAERHDLPTLGTLADLPGCELWEGASAHARLHNLEVAFDLYEPGASPHTSARMCFSHPVACSRHGAEAYGARAAVLVSPLDFDEALTLALAAMGRRTAWRPVRLAVSWTADLERLERLILGWAVPRATFFPRGLSYIDIDGVRASPAGPWRAQALPEGYARVFDYEAREGARVDVSPTGEVAILRAMLDVLRYRQTPHTRTTP